MYVTEIRMVLATQLCAILFVNEPHRTDDKRILCETRRKVLRMKERTDVRD